MADQPIDKSDINKLVEATEKSTGRLADTMDKLYKNQVKSGTTAEIIKQSLPEVLTDTKFGKMADAMQKEADRDRGKDEKIQKTQNKLVNSVKNSLTIQNMSRKKTESAQKMVDAEESEKESRQKKWQAFQKTMLVKQGKSLFKIAGSIFGKGYKTAKTGLMAIVGAAGLMVLYEFLNSKYWNDIINNIKDWDMKAFSKKLESTFGGFYSYFMGGKNPLTGKREGGLFDRISNTFADFRDKPLMEAIKCMWDNFSWIEMSVLGVVALLALRPVLGPLGLIASIGLMWMGFRKIKNAVDGVNKVNTKQGAVDARQRAKTVRQMRLENMAKPGTHTQASISQAAGAVKGEGAQLGKGPLARKFSFDGNRWRVDRPGHKTHGQFASRKDVFKLQNKLSGNSMRMRSVNFYKSWPKLMKFLRFPLISSLFAIPEAYSIMTNNKMSTNEKAMRLGGLLSGTVTSGLGAVLGGLIGSKVPVIGTVAGSIVGGILGYVHGEAAGQGFMQWLLGEKVTQFPEWSGLNDIFNGMGVRGGAADLKKTSSQLAARKQIRNRFTGGRFFDQARKGAGPEFAGFGGRKRYQEQFFGENLNYRLNAEDVKTFRLAGMPTAAVKEGMTLRQILSRGGYTYFTNQSRGFRDLQNRGIEEINKLKEMGAGDMGAATIINNIIQDNSRNALGQQSLVIDHTGTPYGQPSQVGTYY